MAGNFEKDINVPSKRPDWRITLQSDHIKRLEQDLDFERTKRKSLQADLKEKEQECEELKEQLERADEDIKMKCTRCAMTNQLDEQLDQLKEQIKYQNNFIESLLKATNNSEWLDKSILDDEAGEIIEKIELDYIQLDQLKRQHQGDKGLITSTGKMNYQLLQEYDKLKTALTEIKEICKKGKKIHDDLIVSKEILQKISECEVE